MRDRGAIPTPVRPTGDGLYSQFSRQDGFRNLSWSQGLYALGVITLPLQAVFTVSVGGIDLQVPQVFLLSSVLLAPFRSKQEQRPRRLWDLYLVRILLAVTVVGGLLSVIFVPVNGPLPGIFNPALDSYQQILNIGLVLLGWHVGCSLPLEVWRRVLLIAIWVAFFGVLVQLALGNLGYLELLSSVGFHTKQSLGTLSLSSAGLREGTFYNGQDLGFFSAAGTLIAIRYRAYWSATVSIFCLLYSQSTTGYLCLLVGAGILLLLRANLKMIVALSAVGLLFGVTLALSPTVRETALGQVEKVLPAESSTSASGSDSLEVRTMKTEVALGMFASNPLVGVGAGRYGVFFWDDAISSDMPHYYADVEHRPIVENAYAQVLAESGLLGFIPFILLLLWYFARMRKGSPLDLALLVAIAVGASTQGSWVSVPFWFMLAYLGVLARDDMPMDGRTVGSLRATAM